ncbi:hypothetical protein KR067_011486 [Drosophila pandora]|nr:hypothetical protein KR067_011486 [Drosophila pandora]
MNFNPASVVAAAAAAAHQHPHHQYLNHHHHHHQLHHHPTVPVPVLPPTQQLIPLPSVGGGGNSIQVGGGGGDTSPKIMEWTNDDALELIEQYRCHTELWNRADPKYKDKLCRFRAWSEIAERFGCSKAEVERKMNVLLTQYRREKHKMFVKIYQGIQPNPSKWYAFKRFDFMEAGGGSLSAGAGGGAPGSGVNTTGGNLVPNPVSSSAAAAAHNGLNGLAAAAVAAAAYESGTIAAAGNGGAPTGVGGGGGAPGSQMQHRRIKGKELKYFGAMGLNIPMLIASQSQTLDSWNTAGQYSPPISGSGGGGSDRGGGSSGGGGGVAPPPQQLRVPLPMSYHSGGGGGGGGGGSSSSDFQQSPLKTMDTSDNEDNNNSKEDVAAAAALGQLAAKVERRSPAGGAGPGGGSIGGGGGGSSSREANDPASDSMRSERALSETGSSPIPNTNMHEAHKNHLLSSPVSGRAVTPRQAHEQLHHHTTHPHSHTTHQQLQQQQHGHEELDIKQELVDYFHGQAGGVVVGGGGGGVAPPPPPESHRSYSSAGEESRLPLVDMAQDLRVAQAKANFGAFVLPPRNSDLASAVPTMPLNMRKLTEASSAGHMLMNSLLGSRESMSDGEDPDPDNDEATESAASPGHIKSSVSAQAAVTSAFYAESLNRDDCDFIGSNVALKLRTMDRTQRIIAEKLISEVLYYGQFNELERSARIQPK